MGALEAVQAEAGSPPEGPAVPLVTDAGTVDITVPPPGRWKSRANSALRVGDFEEWAVLVLSDEDAAAWADADPTNDDVETFFKAWQELSGENRGKSRPSPRSSENTARR